MFEILTGEQARALDQNLMKRGISSFELIYRAAQGATAEITRRFSPCPVLVLCGPGKNGADGFVIASLLKKEGWEIRVACLTKTSFLEREVAQATALWSGEVEELNSNLSLKNNTLVIDSIFGTGFRGELHPEITTLFKKITTRDLLVIAIDVPSGVCATNATVAKDSLHANLTLTFSCKKNAHVLYPGCILCGETVVLSLGEGLEDIQDLGQVAYENNPLLWMKFFPFPTVEDHKYTRGQVTVIGGERRTGAACLAAAAAQKIGAGVVSILSRLSSLSIYAHFRASVMVDSWSDLEELKTLLRDERKNVVVLGPGLGVDAEEIAETVLSFRKAAVLDGDIFTIYKKNPMQLFEKTSPRQILTPHSGEFDRLFPDISGKNKIEKTKKAAMISNSIVAFKGSDTVIAAPSGESIINTEAPATLATAGSGDVLSGFIAGLASQGMPLFFAAAAASWVHAQSGQQYGPGLTAEDIISSSPTVLKMLLEEKVNLNNSMRAMDRGRIGKFN